MDKEIEEIIKKQMEILPIEVRKLFSDPGLKDKILNIGKKNGLNEDQLGTLQLETNLVMLGLVHPDKYSDELKSHLNVNDIKIDNIVNDINKELLTEIREKLIGMFDEEPESKWDWKENLDFILPGGDYSALVEERINQMPETPTIPVNPPSLRDIKNKLEI